MQQLVETVLKQLDKGVLDHLLGQLRMLDNELDVKIEDIHIAEQQVSVWDRINVFTTTDAEHELKEENKAYKEIRQRHAEVIAQVKELIRAAMHKDFGVALKIQAGEIHRKISTLKIEHRHGVGLKAHHYRITGLDHLWNAYSELSTMIDEQYNFPKEIIDADQLLHAVYDEVLRRSGFIE